MLYCSSSITIYYVSVLPTCVFLMNKRSPIICVCWLIHLVKIASWVAFCAYCSKWWDFGTISDSIKVHLMKSINFTHSFAYFRSVFFKKLFCKWDSLLRITLFFLCHITQISVFGVQIKVFLWPPPLPLRDPQAKNSCFKSWILWWLHANMFVHHCTVEQCTTTPVSATAPCKSLLSYVSWVLLCLNVKHTAIILERFLGPPNLALTSNVPFNCHSLITF